MKKSLKVEAGNITKTDTSENNSGAQHSEPEEKRSCADCGVQKPKRGYSNRQWRLILKSGEGSGACMQCIVKRKAVMMEEALAAKKREVLVNDSAVVRHTQTGLTEVIHNTVKRTRNRQLNSQGYTGRAPRQRHKKMTTNPRQGKKKLLNGKKEVKPKRAPARAGRPKKGPGAPKLPRDDPSPPQRPGPVAPPAFFLPDRPGERKVARPSGRPIPDLWTEEQHARLIDPREGEILDRSRWTFGRSHWKGGPGKGQLTGPNPPAVQAEDPLPVPAVPKHSKRGKVIMRLGLGGVPEDQVNAPEPNPERYGEASVYGEESVCHDELQPEGASN